MGGGGGARLLCPYNRGKITFSFWGFFSLDGLYHSCRFYVTVPLQFNSRLKPKEQKKLSLKDASEGYIGKLQLLKSGKARYGNTE